MEEATNAEGNPWVFNQHIKIFSFCLRSSAETSKGRTIVQRGGLQLLQYLFF